MFRTASLCGFAALQLFTAMVLFLSEVWVFSTSFAPRISSFMAFPFALVLFVSGTLAGRAGCRRSAARRGSPLFLASLFLSLLWMAGFGMGYWSSWFALEKGTDGGVWATWFWISLALLQTTFGSYVFVQELVAEVEYRVRGNY